jgi:hypothetical protein
MFYFYLKVLISSFPLIKIITGVFYAKILNLISWATAVLWFARLNDAEVPAELIKGLVLVVFIALSVRLISALLIRKTYVEIFRNYRGDR